MAWSFFGGKQQHKHRKSRRQDGRRQSLGSGTRLNRFEQLEARHLLAVLTVNTNLDTTASDTVLTLREALTVVNTGSTAGLSAAELAQVNTTTALGTNDVIQFDSTFFATPKTIALTAPGQLPIQKSLTIMGTGSANLTIDATAAASRIFQIDAGDVSIKGLTLTKGAPAAGNGGAINSTTLGTLMVADSVITGSTAVLGGGIFATGDLVLTTTTVGGIGAGLGNTATTKGGGIYDSGGTITLKNSNVLGNSATGSSGGGIYSSAIVNLQTSIVNANTAGSFGGGIEALTVMMQNTLIAGNTAGTRGGGIDSTTLVSTSSTILGNTATTSTGGGADSTTAVLKNSTVSGNTATVGNGGGIRGTNVTVQNSTIAGNGAGPAAAGGGIFANTMLTVQNSIIANNTALTFPDLNAPATTSVRYSLIGESGTIPSAGQFTITGPGAQNAAPFKNFIGNAVALMPITATQALGTGAGTVAPNGGPTPTIDITGSIAIDKGSNALAVNPSQGDQRGLPFARISPFGGVVDMGAFEVQTATVGNNPPVLVTPIPNQTATVGTAFTLNAGGFFSDPDHDPLTFAAERVSGLALPDWLTFNSSTGTFSGVPTAADVGSIQIKVTATDNKTAPATSPPLPSSTFTLTVSTAPVIPPVGAELPFNENFEGPVPAGQIAPDPRIKEKSPAFATTTTAPINGTASLQATRPTVGSRPVATVDFTNPATAATVSNVAVNVSTGGGNGTTLWNNAVVVFDYQSPTNYKFAGVFQIIHKLIIGQVVNGKVSYLAQKAFNAAANTSIPLNVAINHATRQVTLSSGGTSVAYTYAALGGGTVGLGTINANAKFDNLVIT
jgi:predicted outer membrane repeat protein